jgi:hypothetical protein
LKIALSASWSRRPELQRYAAELRSLGHEVVSSWLDIAPNFTEDDGIHVRASPEVRAVIIERDLADIRDAHAFVAFAEPEGSPYTRGTRHFEEGAAYAWGKPIFLVGQREEMLGHWLPRLMWFETWAACVEFLGTLKEGERC